MKHSIFIILFIALSCHSFGQNNKPWLSFWNKDSTLIGFKDSENTVKIEPRFTGFISAKKFDDIIGVSEEVNKKWINYYITKSGRIVGRDSLHIFDNGADCETEGFIRFRDAKTDKEGMFNRKGDIAIPANYNSLTRVINGMVIALQGAKKKSWGKESGDHHFSWEGGKQILIDTNNRVLIDDFKSDGRLDYFSLLISDQPDPNPIRKNFKTLQGKYYSFIDFRKEFDTWLKTALLKDFTKERLLAASFKELTDGWKAEENSTFINRNFELIKTKFMELNRSNCKYQVFQDGLNPFIFESANFERFYNNCGEAKEWIYPVMNIVVSHGNGKEKDFYQDNLTFLRTEEGYKFISVDLEAGQK